MWFYFQEEENIIPQSEQGKDHSRKNQFSYKSYLM